jgi:hypothetical protein
MLPPSIQKFLTKFTGLTEWTFLCYKNTDGTWGFDIPYLLTFNEKFINGTEQDLDIWYEKLSGIKPDLKSKLYLTVSSKEIKDTTTTCTFIGDDDFESYFNPSIESIDTPSYYLDNKTGYTIWLCQYLQFLFKEKPQTLYLKLGIKD